MATATQNDYIVTNEWTNIAATIGAASLVDLVIQCLSTDNVRVVFGGTEPVDGKSGIVLQRYDSVQGNAAAIWVRSFDPAATVSVTLL